MAKKRPYNASNQQRPTYFKKKVSFWRRQNNFFVRRGKLQVTHLLLVVLILSVASFQITHWINRQQAPNQAQINEPDAAVKKAFIEKIAPVAQQEQKDYQIFASIILAQAALESDWGRSELATKYNNLFGVKGTGVNSALMKTKEYINGQWIVVKANFRVYPSWSASVKDHTQLLVKGTDWDRAHYQTVVQAGNYQKAARALQQEGYATDPNYADKLINLIEKYDLNQYDY